MNDDGTPPPPELRKKARRLVSRWSELNKEHTSGEISDAERRQELWLTPPAPYPGLRSFARNESELFFAREQQIDGLIQRLTNSNIMVVLGGSGCGKSSLVRAGLIPRLSTSGAVPGRAGRWYVVEYHPGRDPNNALLGGFRDSILAPVSSFMPSDDREPGRRELVHAFDLDKDLVKQEPRRVLDQAMAKISTKLFAGAKDDALRSASLAVDGLFEFALDVLDRIDIELSRGARAGRPNLLILIDQFEEAFRPEVTTEGLRNLCTLIKTTFKRRPPSLFLAITLRSEELHRCAEAGLANIVTETAYLVGPLDDAEARREIIVKPARAVFSEWLGTHRKASASDTAPFEPDVVQILMDESQRILSGAGYKSDYLPLLQHALQQVWNSAMTRWSRELAENSSLDLRIRMDDLKDVTTGLEPGFLTRCLNEFVNQAYDEAVAEVAVKRFGNDSKAAEKAARAVQTTFCSMARQDDRGNWARRSVSAKWVAELLDDIEPDPDANRKAADDVLRIFHKHGYLNRSVVRQGEEYDVSHEALIRNWTKYDVWLRELGTISNSVREVVDDLESRKQSDASVQARRSPRTILAKTLRTFKQFWDRILDWLLETKEKQATALITDEHRDNLGKVVGAERTVSIGLAAALLADSERRRSARMTGSSIILDEPTGSDSRQRSQLEIRMRERIEEIGPDWRLADVASRRPVPRLIIVQGLLGVIVLAVLGGLMSSILKNMELTRSQNRLYFGAVAAAGNLDVPRWLEASAFELERVYNRIAEHRSEENWANNPSALGEMSLSMSNWERAARQLTGAVVIRDPTDAPAEIPKANCSIAGTELLRRVGAISFGVTFDGSKKSWWPRIKTASRTDTVLAPDARLYPLAKEGDMVCLSRNIPLVLVWPAGKDEEPQFWMLRLRCQTFVGSTCATWLSEPLRMRVLFSKNYANVQGEPPWRKLWQSKLGRGVGASLWENMDVYDFSSAVQNAPPRTGFAFKFDDEWLIADMTPGVNSPYILSMSSDMQHVCADEDCVFEMKFSKLRIKNGPKFKDSAGKCTAGGNCPVVLDVLAVPSEGNEFLPIWGWTLPGASIDVIATDGKIMDFHDLDGLWRRSVIGVQTLAEHVRILAGSMSDEPLKVKLDVLDLSDACQKTNCQDWKPVAESAAQSWHW